MKKNAFTMIELVLVIVVIAIIAANAIPRFDRDLTQDAADKVLSSIRYTQHLALIDDKQEFNNSKWQRAFWQIRFVKCNEGGLSFTIASDNDLNGGLKKAEAALDPLNNKPIYSTNSSCSSANEYVLLGKKYGVEDISGAGGCEDVKYIGFDHFGRPQVGFSNSDKPNEASYMTNDCNFTFTMSDDKNFSINIQAETGYASINGEPNS